MHTAVLGEDIKTARFTNSSVYVSIRRHTSAYVSIHQLPVIADGIKTARFTNSSVSDSSSTLEILRNKCESSSPSVESSHSRRSCRSGLRQNLYFCTSSCVSICTLVLANLVPDLNHLVNVLDKIVRKLRHVHKTVCVVLNMRLRNMRLGVRLGWAGE